MRLEAQPASNPDEVSQPIIAKRRSGGF